MTKSKAQKSLTESFSNPAAVTRILSTFPIAGADLAYFKLVHKVEFPDSALDNLRAHFADTVDCGFQRPRAIHSFADDKAAKLKGLEMLHVVPAGFRDAARTTSYMEAFMQFEKQFRWKGDFMDDFLRGAIDLDDIIYLDTGCHMLFDRNKEVIPVGLSFDYTNAAIHEGAYHLEKALGVLAKDPRVIPLITQRAKRLKPEQVPALAIIDVDSCNAEPGRMKTISFTFAPTVEDMRAIWAKAQSYDTKYPSTTLRQAIFDLDLLGLRAAGAAKYDTFWGVDERPVDDSDCGNDD